MSDPQSTHEPLLWRTSAHHWNSRSGTKKRKPVLLCKPGKWSCVTGPAMLPNVFCEENHISYPIKSLFCLPYSEAVSFCEMSLKFRSVPSTSCTPFLASSTGLPHWVAICYYLCCRRSTQDANEALIFSKCTVMCRLRAGSSVVTQHKPNVKVHHTGDGILCYVEVHVMSLFWLAISLVLGLPILTSFFQAGSTI